MPAQEKAKIENQKREKGGENQGHSRLELPNQHPTITYHKCYNCRNHHLLNLYIFFTDASTEPYTPDMRIRYTYSPISGAIMRLDWQSKVHSVMYRLGLAHV